MLNEHIYDELSKLLCSKNLSDWKILKFLEIANMFSSTSKTKTKKTVTFAKKIY